LEPLQAHLISKRSGDPRGSREIEKGAGEGDPRSHEIARHGAVVGQELGPSIEELRRALDDAIVARAWSAVTAINDRLRTLERADVVDLDKERARKRER
jgi:hypothetical protein